MSNTISEDMLLYSAPDVLKSDEGMNPLVQVLAKKLSKLSADSLAPIIYAKIDQLSEGLLDMLANDFKVDWYDYNWDLETKRRSIADAFNVHRHLGTAGAVKSAIQDIWPLSYVREWFEYGGEPYHYRIYVVAGYGEVDDAKVHQAIRRVVNVRSVLDSISYSGETGETTLYTMAAAAAMSGYASGVAR